MKILSKAWKQYPGALEVWINNSSDSSPPVAIKTAARCYIGYAKQDTNADSWGLRAREQLDAWLIDWDDYEWRCYCVEGIKQKSVAIEVRPKRATLTLPEYTIRTLSGFTDLVSESPTARYYLAPEWVVDDEPRWW